MGSYLCDAFPVKTVSPHGACWKHSCAPGTVTLQDVHDAADSCPAYACQETVCIQPAVLPMVLRQRKNAKSAPRFAQPGKPLFVSALVYLNASWPMESDAETLAMDEETDTGVLIRPRPGRVVLMDQVNSPPITATYGPAWKRYKRLFCLQVPPFWLPVPH